MERYGVLMTTGAWSTVQNALDFAWNCIHDDVHLNDRERADGERYLQFIVATAAHYSLLSTSPDRPRFIPPLEASRWLGASGPDIDYDVAAVEPGVRYRISGKRGESSYVGICVYANDPQGTAVNMVANVDVDSLVDLHGSFTFEFEHPAATRVIIRQYFHDRLRQDRGSWSIERVVAADLSPAALPSPASVEYRLSMMANSIRWNAELNRLWGADLRSTPNRLVIQSAQEIVAAVPNPDVTYAFGWWRLEEGQRLEIDVVPPAATEGCRYWGLQVCDRWFQSHPDRLMNINDRGIVCHDDGSATIVISDNDPGHPNWLRTYGHTQGTMFFRWLHHTPISAPMCRVMPARTS